MQLRTCLLPRNLLPLALTMRADKDPNALSCNNLVSYPCILPSLCTLLTTCGKEGGRTRQVSAALSSLSSTSSTNPLSGWRQRTTVPPSHSKMSKSPSEPTTEQGMPSCDIIFSRAAISMSASLCPIRTAARTRDDSDPPAPRAGSKAPLARRTASDTNGALLKAAVK